MSRRGGAVFLSSLRLLLAPRYTAVRQLELKNGLRLTPVTATSFAIVHRRNYASSTNSSDDDQKNLEKHKKESEVNQGGDLSNSENDIKDIWEDCERCKSHQNPSKDLEFKHRPDDGLAIRAEQFTKNQMEKKMKEKFKTYKNMEDMFVERKIRRKQIQQEAVGAGRKNGMKENAIDGIKKWRANKRNSDSIKLINKIVWNVFKWKKSSNNETKMQHKNDTQVKKFHSMADSRFKAVKKDKRKPRKY